MLRGLIADRRPSPLDDRSAQATRGGEDGPSQDGDPTADRRDGIKLPNAQLAVVEREKVVDYLLNPAHPDNGGKVRFFFAMGFTCRDWPVLTDALRRHALNTPVARWIVDRISIRTQVPSGRTGRHAADTRDLDQRRGFTYAPSGDGVSIRMTG